MQSSSSSSSSQPSPSDSTTAEECPLQVSLDDLLPEQDPRLTNLIQRPARSRRSRARSSLADSLDQDQVQQRPSIDSNHPSDLSDTSNSQFMINYHRNLDFANHSSRVRSSNRSFTSLSASIIPNSSPSNRQTIQEPSTNCTPRRRKRSQSSNDKLQDVDSIFNHEFRTTTARSTKAHKQQPSEPTTAELAEAAARASNPDHALPGFYSPDESLKVTKVVIPIDTNPMERRKIISDASKDGTIRWRDANQKSMYERSKDGLVGEEIGEVEFNYICLPSKSARKSDRSIHRPRISLDSISDSSSSSPSSTPQPQSTRILNEAARSYNSLREGFERLQSSSRYLETRSRRERNAAIRNYRSLSNIRRQNELAASRTNAPEFMAHYPYFRFHPVAAMNPWDGPLSEDPINRTTGLASSETDPNSRLTRRPISWLERPIHGTTASYPAEPEMMYSRPNQNLGLHESHPLNFGSSYIVHDHHPSYRGRPASVLPSVSALAAGHPPHMIDEPSLSI